MPKVAINEHMCLNYGEKKKKHDFFLQTLQLKLPNVVTQILRNKNKLRFKLECRNTLNIIISGQFNICTNLPSIVNLKTKIPMFDTLAIEDVFLINKKNLSKIDYIPVHEQCMTTTKSR